MSEFDEAYFERGLESGLSCYENYHWMGDVTVDACRAIMRHTGIIEGQRVLDFGCCKGYYVKAMRMLKVMAEGWDISKYAIANCDPDVKEHLKLLTGTQFPESHWFDWVIAKDVLEHMTIEQLRHFFQHIPAGRAYLIIPLGVGHFYDKRNDMDKTHKTCMPAWWWGDFITRERWSIVRYDEQVDGIKQTWASRDAYGHFLCARLDETKGVAK